MKANKNTLVLIALLAAFAIWANSFIAVSLLRLKLSALQLLAVRFIPAGLLCALIALLFYRKTVTAMLREFPYRLISSGILLVMIYNFFIHYCLAHITPSAGALFTAFTPLFTLFLAFDILGEPFTVSRAFGALIAFDGMFVVVLFGKVGGQVGEFMSLADLPYALMIVGGCLAMAAYTVIAKPIMSKYPPMAVNCVVIFIGSLPLWVMVDRNLIELTKSLNNLDWAALAFLAVAATIIAFQLWLFAVKYWKASNVNLVSFVVAPLTALFAYIYYGTRVTPFFVIGGLVILGGVIFAISDDLQKWVRSLSKKQTANQS